MEQKEEKEGRRHTELLRTGTQSPHTPESLPISRLFRRYRHNSAAFPDRNYLVGFHLRESFQLSRCRPLHLDEIYRMSFPQAEVQSQVALRHHAGSAVDLVHLNMVASCNAHARTDRGAIALGPNQ